MSRLEIGSMVRVIDEDDRQELVGKIGKVVAYSTRDENVVVQFEGMDGRRELHSASIDSDRPLDGRRDKWFIYPKHLELIEKENKQMTKKDLKSGMTVKLRNGNVYLVVNDFLTREHGYMPLGSCKEDLTALGNCEYDVVEVYQSSAGKAFSYLIDVSSYGMKLLWKRQELPKLSTAERVILENIDKLYKWIARDSDDALYVYTGKPTKYSSYWNGYELILGGFPKLFTFVKWEDEQPYSIEELLKNC